MSIFTKLILFIYLIVNIFSIANGSENFYEKGLSYIMIKNIMMQNLCLKEHCV